jgi:hypothetical protein
MGALGEEQRIRISPSIKASAHKSGMSVLSSAAVQDSTSPNRNRSKFSARLISVRQTRDIGASKVNAATYDTALENSMPRYGMRLVLIATAAAIAFVALCIAGIVARYSPVPLGDDWAGYVGFNLDIIQGKTSAWFANDGEHRIVVPRILLWLDFHVFGARFIFLIVANVIVSIGFLVTLIAYAREKIQGRALFVLAALSTVLVFSWMQAPSFYHGWTGVIAMLPILCPLLGFYWLHRARMDSLWFFPAALIGFVSIGTQGNGLCVLPIMTVMSALIGLGVRRTVILAVLSVASFILYFWHFNWGLASPEEMSADPITFTLFILTFLGGPFYYVIYYWLGGLLHLAGFVFGHGALLVTNNYLDYPASRIAGIVVATMAGAVLVIATTALAWRWLRSERTDSWQAALLAFIGFIIASAVLAAIGRAKFGFDYAVQERYMTGPMLAWQALAILLLARLETRKVLRTLSFLVVLVPIALLPNQLKAVLKPDLQDQMARERSLNAIRTGQSDDEEVARQVKRLREMGIEIGVMRDQRD